MRIESRRRRSSESSKLRYAAPRFSLLCLHCYDLIRYFRILAEILQHTSGNKKAEEDANREAEEQIKAIKIAGEKRKDEVKEGLLKAVWDVKPTVPERIEIQS
jgi:hypothetical protein